jgi:hypothetical protein
MKSNALKLALPVVAALVAGGNVASATTYNYSSYSVTNEQTIQITGPHNVFGGMGQVVLHGSSPNIGVNLTVWCLDIYDWLQNSGTYNSGILSLNPGGSQFVTLSALQQNEIASLALHGNAHIGDSFNTSAAIQLAIWEIEYGNTFTFTGVSSAVQNLAALYISYLSNIWGGTYTASLLTASGNQSMTFIDIGQGQVVNPTPLPSSWTMLIAGFVGLGFLAYRRTKKNTAAFAAA